MAGTARNRAYWSELLVAGYEPSAADFADLVASFLLADKTDFPNPLPVVSGRNLTQLEAASMAGVPPSVQAQLASIEAAKANKVTAAIANRLAALDASGNLLDSGETVVGLRAGRRNAVINGGCQLAQRAAPNLSTSYQYGKTDRFAAKADGTVGAGTSNHAETALLGRSGYASHLSGVTLTGAGAVYWRHRIESHDVQHFINQAAVVSCRVYHDVGSAINYTLTVNRANAKDDFSAVTLVLAASNLSVASGTEAALQLAVASLGACGNGVEIIIKADCAAVTTKNFHLTELQLEPGAVATEFERLPMGLIALLGQRYYQKSYPLATNPGTATDLGRISHRLSGSVGASGGLMQLSFAFPVGMRAAPAVTIYSPTGAAGVAEVNNVNRATTVGGISERGFTTVNNDSATVWNDQEVARFHFVADAEI